MEEKETKNKEVKIGFFKKVWYSITKIEKYPDMATQGLKKSMSYLAKGVAIFTIILSLGMIYQFNNLVQKGIKYLQNEFPDFYYENGTLNVESEKELITLENNSAIGKIIIDTKTEDEQTINQYIQNITDSGEGIVILKDKVIVRNSAVVGTISYMYKDTFESMGINQFSKQDVINYVNSSQIITLYSSIVLTVFIYAFIVYLLSVLSNAILLSCFGYITTLLARIKIRYVAIFNMSIYALTLSVILNMLYIGINIFVPFSIQYFQVMYIAVAAVYLVAAILILKTEIMKQQFELMKIMETEESVRQEMKEKEQEQEQKDKEKEEKEERKKKDKEEEQKENKKKDKEEKNKNKEDNKDNKKTRKNKEEGEEPNGSEA